jgi:plastocyanin
MTTRIFSVALIAVATLATTSTAVGEETATLRVTFKYKGTPPKFDPIQPTVDQAFCGMKTIPDETLVVNPENMGLKNVVVWVKTGRSGTDLPEMELEPKTHELANKDCRFQPHVIVAKVGDTVKVTNPDKVGHNANFQGFNLSQNVTVPAGGEVDVQLKDTEPSVIPVACNIHPWMKAQLLVVDHPFAATSDENGVLEIKGLPVGMEVTFQANHETGSFRDIIVNGEEDSWRRSRFEMELEPGVNDLGVVELPASAFD